MSPFVSEAQRKKFFAMEARGEIPKGTAKKWAKETGKKKLPERISQKRQRFRKRTRFKRRMHR